MIEEPTDEVPEIHVNRDKDRYFTMLLLKMHEFNIEPTKDCSRLSGVNDSSQNNPDEASYFHQASGDMIFLSSENLENNYDQPKHSKYIDNNSGECLDYSLPVHACINSKSFAYQAANGYYSNHKKSVQIKTKRRTNRNTVNKTVQETEEEQSLQLLLEFQRYLSQLVSTEVLDSVEKTANRDERTKQSVADKPKKSNIQKSFSASTFGVNRQTKHSLPSVQSKPTNVVLSRPSSFHSVLPTSGPSKLKQTKDSLEHDTNRDVKNDVWSSKGENDERSNRTAGQTNRIKSHADIEIMQKVRDRHQSLMQTGVLPHLGSATNFDQMSDSSHFAAGSTDSKAPQLTRNNGRNSDAWLNSKSSDFLGSQAAFTNDNDCFSGSTALPQFPLRRNPFAGKPRVPHHVVSLATGSCVAQQATPSKQSLHGLEMFIHTLNPIVRSGNHISSPSTLDNLSNAKATSGILPLEGKKMKTRRSKHRIL